MVVISQEKDHTGKHVEATCEEVGHSPLSSLLRELDKIDVAFIRSYSIVDENFQDNVGDCATEAPPIILELETEIEALVPFIVNANNNFSPFREESLLNTDFANTGEIL